MKKLLIALSFFLLPTIAFAQFTTQQGGTGTSSPSGLLYGDGTIRLKTVVPGANCTFSGGVFNCTGGGGSGSGTVSTSTALVNGQVDFSTGASTIGNDSTFLFDTSLKKLTINNASTSALSAIASLAVGSTATSTIVGDNGTTVLQNKLAIGTTTFDSAGDALVVWSNANSYTRLVLNNSAPTKGTSIRFMEGSTLGGAFTFNNSNSDLDFNSAGNASSIITFSTGSGITERMRIDQNGLVGIGTTSPYAQLSVMLGDDYASHAKSTAFAIGSSTAGAATSTLFSVDSAGNTNLLGSLTLSALTGTQCLHEISGVVSGTGADCGSGGGGAGLASTTAFGAWTGGNVAVVYSNGSVYGQATTSLTFSGPFNGFSALGALVGGSNSTITWTGLATTSQPASSNLLVSNGASGVYGVGTSTLTASGPLTGSFTQVGSGGSLGCTTAASGVAGCLSNTSFDIFNNKQAPGFQISTTSSIGISKLAYFVGTTPTSLGGVATTSVSAGTGLSGTLTTLGSGDSIINTGVISNSCPGGFLTCSGTNPSSFTLGTLGIANGGTATTTFYDKGVLFYNGTLATISQASVQGSFVWDNANTRLGIGTTTPGSILSIGGASTGTNFFDNATTTKSGTGGYNIATGCFSIAGTCIGGGSGSGTVGSGTQGQFPFYNSAGTTLTATSSIFIAQNQQIGIGTTTPKGNLGIQTSLNIANAFSVANAVGSTTFEEDTIDTNPNVFIIASSTGQNYLRVTAAGYLVLAGTSTPALTSCGTSPSILNGGPLNFSIQVGSVAATGCTATFPNAPLPIAPVCNVTERTGSVVNAMTYTVSTAAVVVSQTGLTGDILDVNCLIGNTN